MTDLPSEPHPVAPEPQPAIVPVEPTQRTRGRKSKKPGFRRAVSDVPLRFADLMSGLPALALAILALAPVAWARITTSRSKLYGDEAAARFNHGDYAGAVVCFKRLVGFRPEPELRFLMASALERSGEYGKAEGLMRALAPEGKPGLPMAEFWLGRHLLIQPNLSPTLRESGELHLRRFLDADTSGMPPTFARDAKALLGALYADTGRLREARAFLQQSATKTRPDLLLKLSYVCRGLHEDAEARRTAEEAQRMLLLHTEQHPGDREARLLLAKSYCQLGDYTGAVDVLSGATLLLGEQRWRSSMAAIHVDWADALLTKKESAKDWELFQVIEDGLRYDPKNLWLLSQLNGVLNSDDAGSDKARNLLRSMLASGKGVVVAHFALGTDAWRHGRLDEARMHWEQASQLEESSPEIANNLAYLLAHQKPTDVPRALAIIVKALATAPPANKPLLHGTHGQILCKLTRWNEALPELELALKGGQDTPGIHTSLAEAYDALGMKDMAAEHRNRASQASAPH